MNTLTFTQQMAYEDLLIFSKQNIITVKAILCLLSKTDIMTKIKNSHQKELAFISQELAKIDKSLKIECDTEVLEALKQTRYKWLFKLLAKREELDKVNKILAILMLLNRESCK